MADLDDITRRAILSHPNRVRGGRKTYETVLKRYGHEFVVERSRKGGKAGVGTKKGFAAAGSNPAEMGRRGAAMKKWLKAGHDRADFIYHPKED